MNDSAKEETIAKAFCSSCEGERNCDILGSHRVFEDMGPVWGATTWRILRCRGCDEVFCQTVSVFSEDVSYEFDEHGEPTEVLDETKKYWPSRATRSKPDWYDELHGIEPAREKLNGPLDELYGALNADLPMLSGIAIRTCFEIVAELLGVDPKITFEEKLKVLVNNGKLGASAEATISTAIEAGHAATHRGWVPEPDDLTTLVDILEAFIRDTLIEPARQKRLGERAAKLKDKVPPNPRKRKFAHQNSRPANEPKSA